jgi:hypothetical protein
MRKIGLVVAGLILATAGTGAWASSANAGEPAKAMADSCCIGRDGVISKASCPYLPQPYALYCVPAQASVKKDRGVVSYPSRVPGHTIPGVLRAIRLSLIPTARMATPLE